MPQNKPRPYQVRIAQAKLLIKSMAKKNREYASNMGGTQAHYTGAAEAYEMAIRIIETQEATP